MNSVREATDDLLAEKPDVESDLRELLAVDERADGWTFDEVPLDSGSFGELVSRDIVVENGDEYEVADPAAVRASLDGETAPVSDDGPTLPSMSLPSVSRSEAGLVGVVLAFVALMRTYIFPSVFRGEYVVLPSNDPYYYRYWVERLATEAAGGFDFSVLSGLPDSLAKGEPLMVATLWWLTSLFGGADAAGWVLAWYPVVSALVVAVLVYGVAVRVTGDRRVGLASVAFLAVIPSFAYRTGLGFADHHAFDYPWLALTALSLVSLADVDREALRDTRPWLAAVVLGVAVAGQVMAWEAGPLLVAAVGVYVAVRAAVDVRADRSSLVANAPILAGLVLASVLAHLMHTVFGWHTNVVAYAPVFLLAGVLTVSLVAETVRWAELPAFVLGATEVAGALGGLAMFRLLVPTYADEVGGRLGMLLFSTGPAETQSLFAGGAVGFFIGPILELGFAWLVGLPTLVWASWAAYQRKRPAWLVVCTYGWYFLALATFQRRFVGELAPFVALVAGYGFVALAAKLDVTAPTVFDGDRSVRATDGGRSFDFPDRGTMTALVVLFLFVSSAGAVQTAVRHEQVKIADDKFDASVWIDDYAEERGLEYPDNYVLTKWGRNRMYNYFVNGEAKSYSFARTHYESFLSSKDPAAEYWKLRDRVGFVVTKDLDLRRKAPAETNYARLHKRFGSAGADGASGAGHYRALYASDDGSVKVFGLVPGATVAGTAPPGETVTISTQVEAEGKTFTYTRKTKANPYGVFGVTVPYAGSYSVEGATKVVPEDAPTAGTVVKWHDREGTLHWPFEQVGNDTVHDSVAARSGTVTGSLSTVSGASGQAVAFDGNDTAVTTNLTAPQEFTIGFWVNPDRLTTSDGKNYQTLVNSQNGHVVTLHENRKVSVRVPGVNKTYYGAGNVSTDEWTHVAVTYNGTHRAIYLDGTLVGSDRIGSGTVDWGGRLRLGNGFTYGPAFDGAMDEVRIYDRALSPDEIRERYESSNGTAA